MNILLACEESQAVTIELRKLGHNAFSCDIQPCSGGHPEWHINQDVLPILNGSSDDFYCRVDFFTENGDWHLLPWKWDMIIAFPPCTDLAGSGARHFERKRANGSQRKSIEFFCKFLYADCERIVIENPVGIISGDYIKKHFPDLAEKYDLPRKPTQIVQPYEHGHGETKATCLWLKNVPKLIPTNIVEGREQRIWKMAPGPNRAKERSKTYPGIARAMANQWA